VNPREKIPSPAAAAGGRGRTLRMHAGPGRAAPAPGTWPGPLSLEQRRPVSSCLGGRRGLDPAAVAVVVAAIERWWLPQARKLEYPADDRNQNGLRGPNSGTL